MHSESDHKLPRFNMSNKSSSNGLSVGGDTQDELLHRVTTSNSVMMTGELFEKLYLQPPTQVKGDLKKVFGNPTPLGLVGLCTALTPLACCLMGWRGAGGGGAANIGVYFFMGGPCLIISGILEFFLGNTFPFIVFTTYGTVFLALAATLQPFYNAAGAYANGDTIAGLATTGYNASLAYWPLMISCLNLFWFICATKINLVFVFVFVTAGTGFATFSGALFAAAEGATVASGRLIQASGGFWFITSILAWYLLLIQLLAVVDFKIQLPVGDLSKYYEDGRIGKRKKQSATREHEKV